MSRSGHQIGPWYLKQWRNGYAEKGKLTRRSTEGLEKAAKNVSIQDVDWWQAFRCQYTPYNLFPPTTIDHNRLNNRKRDAPKLWV